MNWLTVHFEVPPWNTYYLYGLERAAILFGTEKIGDHFWYAEGAAALIGAPFIIAGILFIVSHFLHRPKAPTPPTP
jgi:hypothetical protein